MSWLLLWLTLLLPPAHAELVDRVVAVVGERIVLQSEVTLEGELSRLDPQALPFWSPDHHGPLERMIQATLIRNAAGSLPLYTPSEDAVRARVEALRGQFEERARWQAFLARHGLDEDALRTVFRRRMVVERFLVRSIQVPQDLRQAWLDEADRVTERLRERYRVREVERVGEPVLAAPEPP